MKTLGEFLKEYEAGGGKYPVKVCFPGWKTYYEIIAPSRDGKTVPTFHSDGESFGATLHEKSDWRLWTPPKKTRKEKRYAWIARSAWIDSVVMTSKEDCTPPGEGGVRAPWLDGEIEIEE